MSKQRRYRDTETHEPAGGRDRAGRWEEKRQRFADQRAGSGGEARPLRASTYITLGGIVLVVLFVGFMTLRGGSASTASAAPLQQVNAATSATEGGRVSISVEEVATKKLVAWDYKQGNIKVPLIAYVTPSGAMKVAVRMCEPCNSTSFRVEGTQLVCNACGTRWELETSKGVSGGCQAYPPEVLPGTVADGKLSVDEQKVASWKSRI